MKQPVKGDGKIKRKNKIVRKANPFIKRKNITKLITVRNMRLHHVYGKNASLLYYPEPALHQD